MISRASSRKREHASAVLGWKAARTLPHPILILGFGESVEVVNDHLPRGLLSHFQEQRAGRFEWTSIEEGPKVFRVRITKSTPA